jgi:hypothetical protein
VAAIDFITALGRLLQNGTLRDAFAADAVAFVREIDLGESHRPAFVRLVPADLEFQARVLLRKRFDSVREALPQTCRALGQEAWSQFQRYGRSNGPTGSNLACRDALGFAWHLFNARAAALCPLEFNRVQFAGKRRRLAFHFLLAAPTARAPRRPCAQLFLRVPSKRWHEWLVHLG